MFAFLGKLGCDERGATAVEYGLILALIFLAIAASFGSFAGVVIDTWNYIASAATAAMSG